MNIITIASLLLLVFGLGRDCRAAEFDASSKATETVGAAFHGVSTNGQTYHVRAGGPHSYVGIANAAASNLVAIAFANWRDDGPVFRLTNREPHGILLWNVRVQIKSKDGGTDGLGWDTVYDDYPVGTAKYNSAHYSPGTVGEFRVQHPGKVPWRVCVLYSIDWTDSGKSFSGNYEVISQELKE